MAAALLRSVARKLARAPPPPPPPPPHPRPLLAGGLHGGARSAFPSLATKIARAPPQSYHHRPLLNRGLHSGSNAPPPPTAGDKDKIIEDLRLRLSRLEAGFGLCAVAVSVILICEYFWVTPSIKKMTNRLAAMKRLEDRLYKNKKLEDELMDIVIRADEDEPLSVSLDKIRDTITRAGDQDEPRSAAGNRKQQRNGATDQKGTRAKKLDEQDVWVQICFDTLKEAASLLDEIRADREESQAATSRTSNSAPSEQKEGCSRVAVGSKTEVSP